MNNNLLNSKKDFSTKTTHRRIKPRFSKKQHTNSAKYIANIILVEAYEPEKDPAIKRLRQRLGKIG